NRSLMTNTIQHHRVWGHNNCSLSFFLSSGCVHLRLRHGLCTRYLSDPSSIRHEKHRFGVARVVSSDRIIPSRSSAEALCIINHFRGEHAFVLFCSHSLEIIDSSPDVDLPVPSATLDEIRDHSFHSELSGPVLYLPSFPRFPHWSLWWSLCASLPIFIG